MNERLKELAKQAGFYILSDGKICIPTISEEITDCQIKFAELIVEDAVSILRQEWYDLNNAPRVEGETPRDIGLRVGAKSQTIRLMHKIKEHFGVK